MGVGPSTKETTLHHFRDPLLDVVSNDQDIDLMGIIVVGTPQSNEEKEYVGKRVAVWLESMRADGTIISVRPSGTEPKIKFYFGVKEALNNVEDYEKVDNLLNRKIDRVIEDLGLK